MFNTRELPSDPGKRSVLFLLYRVGSDANRIWTGYTNCSRGTCVRSNGIQTLESTRVFSEMSEYDVEQMKALGCQCCDIVSPVSETMIIVIRNCLINDLVSMES